MTPNPLHRLVSIFDSGERIPSSTLALLAVLFHVVTLGSLLLPTTSPIGFIRAVLVFIDLTFVPGFLLALLIGDEIVGRSSRLLDARGLVYVVGLSLMLVMGTVFVLDVALLSVGYREPLSELPLSVGLTLLVGGLFGAVAALTDRTVPSPSLPWSFLSPAPLGFLLLPLLAIIAVYVRDVAANPVPILLVLSAIALVPLLVTFSVIRERWHALGIWSVGIALLYHKTTAGRFGFSGQPSVINAWRAQRWNPGFQNVYPNTTSVLPNGILFPTYARLSGLDILVDLNVLNPLLVSIIPVALYLVYRRYVGPVAGFLGASLFTFAHPFYNLYPQGGRVATPVLFLALVALSLSEEDLSPVVRSGFALVFALGIAVSHYGTSYYVMFALLGATLILVGFAFGDDLLGRLLDRPRSVSDGGQQSGSWVQSFDRFDRDSVSREGVLSLAFIGFYIVSVVAWYLYVKSGEKFEILPNHIRKTLNSLFGSRGIGGGSTARRVQKSYGTVSIDLSKQLYLILGILMMIGLVKVFYDRFLREEGPDLPDEYLAIATMMLGTFVFTFVVPGAWGGGRPMMIVFTFTSVLAVIGTATVIAVPVRLSSVVGSTGWLEGYEGDPGLKAFAVIVMVLLVLNTGIAAATIFGGRAPSNVATNLDGNPHYESNIQTHLWLITNEQGPVYGDVRAHGHSDWFRPVFAVRSSEARNGHQANKPRGNLDETLESPGIERGYLLMLDHNVNSDVILVGNPRSDVPIEIPLSNYRSELDRRSVLYTTGASKIYFSNVTTGEEVD